jgi:predicted nucleic acid-binding protein
MVWYLDTSAFLKLLVAEEESAALRAWLPEHEPTWSSHLLRTEALRAGTRLGIDHDAIEEALDAVSLILPRATTFLTAGELPPPDLRSIDALHLATALELGSDLEGIVTYDVRMTAGAQEMAIAVLAPA